VTGSGANVQCRSSDLLTFRCDIGDLLSVLRVDIYLFKLYSIQVPFSV